MKFLGILLATFWLCIHSTPVVAQTNNVTNSGYHDTTDDTENEHSDEADAETEDSSFDDEGQDDDQDDSYSSDKDSHQSDYDSKDNNRKSEAPRDGCKIISEEDFGNPSFDFLQNLPGNDFNQEALRLSHETHESNPGLRTTPTHFNQEALTNGQTVENVSEEIQKDVHSSEIVQKLLDRFTESLKKDKNFAQAYNVFNLNEDNKIVKVDFFFESSDYFYIPAARRLMINIANGFLSLINSDPKIRPFLTKIPFPLEYLDIRIQFFSKEITFPRLGNVAAVSLANGVINFDTLNSFNYRIERLRSEPFGLAQQLDENQ